jgi:hypothetical protein
MAIKRPPGVDCLDWEPVPGGTNAKRCRYYLDAGACQMPVRLMCTEWEKVNRHLPVTELPRPFPSPDVPPPVLVALATPAQANPPPPPPPAPDAPLQLTPPAPKPLSKAKEKAQRAYLAALEGGGEAPLAVPAEPYELPPAMTEAEIASLEALAEEIRLTSAELGDIVMVRRYGPDPARAEITFRDLAALRTIVQTLPGARVVGIKRPQVPPPAIDTGGASPRTATATNGRTNGHGVPAPLAMCWGCDAAKVRTTGDLCEACAPGYLTETPLESALNAPFESFPLNGLHCAECKQPQRATAGGPSCPNGHGGAEGFQVCVWCGEPAVPAAGGACRECRV